jgi:NAD(P)-dependent dehydrogenase (short-subunit alcohol dehydrogenase family)
MSGTANRVVVISGASAGIGLATAGRLASQGWSVVGTSRRGTGGENWEGLAMDVDDDQSVEEGIAKVLRDRGHLDAVVANAGYGLAGPVEHTSMAEAKAQLETNFFGAARLVRAAIGPLRARGGGRIVLVSSIGGLIGIPFQAYYSASKFALEGFGEALSYEMAPFGISVSLVEPGNICTEFTAVRRQASNVPAEDPYGEATAKAISRMEQDERKGAPPEAVAEAIVRVLTVRRPPRRVSAGKAEERVGLIAKRLLPFAVFERAARSSLGI